MASLRFDVYIERSPDDVWKVVSDAGAISSWFPGIERSSLEGNIRHCELGGGMALDEEIVTNDTDLRRFQYRITGGAMPVEFHLGTLDVLAQGTGSRVVYSTEIRPDDLAGVVGPAIEGGLKGLAEKLA